MTQLFLMYNMGASGGSWFESVCNTHPEVHAWEEPAVHLGLVKGRRLHTRKELEYCYQQVSEFIQQQLSGGRWATVGLIKGFGPEIVEWAESQDARIVQMVRHPALVLGTKLGKTTWHAQESGLELDERELFELHLSKYHRRYRNYLNRADKYPLVKAEAMSNSLWWGTPYFSQVMEYTTRVEWDEEAVHRVKKQAHPRGRAHLASPLCWMCDSWIDARFTRPANIGIDQWPSRGAHARDSWKSWQHEMYLEYFEGITLSLGYTWPELKS